jgi:hypothetical protein
VIVLDSWPINTASTVGLIPRSIIREAKACRIEWNVTPSMPAFLAASSKPRRVALRGISGFPFLAANKGSPSAE